MPNPKPYNIYDIEAITEQDSMLEDFSSQYQSSENNKEHDFENSPDPRIQFNIPESINLKPQSP